MVRQKRGDEGRGAELVDAGTWSACVGNELALNGLPKPPNEPFDSLHGRHKTQPAAHEVEERVDALVQG